MWLCTLKVIWLWYKKCLFSFTHVPLFWNIFGNGLLVFFFKRKEKYRWKPGDSLPHQNLVSEINRNLHRHALFRVTTEPWLLGSSPLQNPCLPGQLTALTMDEWTFFHRVLCGYMVNGRIQAVLNITIHKPISTIIVILAILRCLHHT